MSGIERVVVLTPKFTADVARRGETWWRWYIEGGTWNHNTTTAWYGNMISSPFFWFVKQEPSRLWYSDVRFLAIA